MKTLRAILGTLVVVTMIWLFAGIVDNQIDFIPASAFIASLQFFAISLVGGKNSEQAQVVGHVLLASVILFSANNLAMAMGLY